jgi:hypothetical protein
MNKYIAYASMRDESDEKRVGLVLERAGFANWKLTEVRLPAMK